MLRETDNITTEWFDVNRGLRQGCLLSPLLFNLFINDLITSINELAVGVDVDGQCISIFAYADDVVLLADNENDLNLLLECLSTWCVNNKMNVNPKKSKVVHFRCYSVDRTDCTFKCGNVNMEIVRSYTYLGLLLTERLDYVRMGTVAANSASRALGLLISKYKVLGGMQYNTFTKLYDAMVWSILDYGAVIWGSYNVPAVNAVQNRAMRFFMGLNKFAPNNAVIGDMAWTPTVVRQWKSVTRFYKHLCVCDNNRIVYKVFSWTHRCAEDKKKNWVWRIHHKFKSLDIEHFIPINNAFHVQHITSEVCERVFNDFKEEWTAGINRVDSKRGNGGNKLRTYRTFKTTIAPENYVLHPLPRSHRSALAKFRCGVAPLKLETGRYANLPISERVCFNCINQVEDESHVLLHCPLYTVIVCNLLSLCEVVCPEFTNFNDADKMSFIMSNPDVMFLTAKTCKLLLQSRYNILFNK